MEKITAKFAWKVHNFVAKYSEGLFGMVTLQEALDKHFKYEHPGLEDEWIDQCKELFHYENTEILIREAYKIWNGSTNSRLISEFIIDYDDIEFRNVMLFIMKKLNCGEAMGYDYIMEKPVEDRTGLVPFNF